LKIAVASKSFLPNVGGIETSTAMIARTWTAAGHDVEVVTAVPDQATWTEPYRVTRTWSARALRTAFAAADVAVTNGYSRAAVVAAALSRRRIVVFHQGYQLICSDGLGFRDRTFHRFDTVADLRLALAQGLKPALHALGRLPFDAGVKRWPGGGIDHVVPSLHVARRLGLERFQVVYQPPNPAVVDAIAELGPPDAEARARAHEQGDIVFFGRLTFEKGCDDLIRAYAAWRRATSAATLRSTRPRLIFYGRGPELRLLEQLVADLGLGADVELRPFLGGRDLVKVARQASVVVIPSRWEEPGATIAVELFACGVPVIASRAGAPGEIFDHHGRLFANGDIVSLTAAIDAHFSTGPTYPRPTGSEPWLLPAIEQALLRILERN
jgi:glycogen synthase